MVISDAGPTPDASLVTLVAVAALTLSVGGCDVLGGAIGQDDKSEALYPTGYGHQLCVSSRREHAFTEGLETFANRGPGPVTIDTVDWPIEGDLALDSVRVFQRRPQDQFATLGLTSGLPQDELTGSERRAWERARPAEGARLDLADPDEGYLVFVIGFTGTSGTAGPLTVHYTDAEGEPGTVTSLVNLRVATRCAGAAPRPRSR